LIDSESYVRGLLQLPNGNILLGVNEGIIEWNPTKHTFTKLKFPKNTKVISLEIDHLQQIWVGTWSGLYLSKDTSLQFKPFLQDYIDAEMIVDITWISDSLLIVGTNKRIIGIDPRTATSDRPIFKSFNHHNGYMTIEAAQNGIKAFGDQIWIPGIAGLSIINKNNFRLDVNEFDNLWIEAINKHPLTFKQNNNPIYTLKYNVNNLVIDYTAIGANRPDEKLYSYRLLGKNDEWSPWTKDQTAFFNQLASGTYTFCLRKKNTTNHDDDDEIQVTVKVHLSITKEPYFPYLAAGVIIFGLLMGGFAVFVYINKKRALKAQEKIAETQRQLNKKLKKKNEIIQLFSKNVRHYARRALITAQKGILRDAIKKEQVVQDFAKDAAMRINSYLEVLNMLRTSENPWLNVSEYTHKLTESLANATNSDHFSVHFHLAIDENLLMHTSRLQSLAAIITELTLNSYNHAKPKNNELNIHITLTKVANNQYLLTFKDNGKGVPKPAKNTTSEGLSIIQAYAGNLQGHVEFKGSVEVLFFAEVDE